MHMCVCEGVCVFHTSHRRNRILTLLHLLQTSHCMYTCTFFMPFVMVEMTQNAGEMENGWYLVSRKSSELCGKSHAWTRNQNIIKWILIEKVVTCDGGETRSLIEIQNPWMEGKNKQINATCTWNNTSAK